MCSHILWGTEFNKKGTREVICSGNDKVAVGGYTEWTRNCDNEEYGCRCSPSDLGARHIHAV
jgi:hypothetical protein